MSTAARALAAVAACGLVLALPATSVFAIADVDAVARDLASDAAQIVAEEHQLLILNAPDSDLSPADRTESRARLQAVDAQGYDMLMRLDRLGIDLSEAVRTVLSPLPAVGPPGVQAPPSLPPAIVYDAAVADLQRLADTPDAVTMIDDGHQEGRDSFALLAIAAAALVALGLAALANIVRPRGGSELEALAWSDGLTGIGNRRRLDRDIAAANRSGDTPTAVIMIDIDHFKQVNDKYGHGVGDDILRRFSSLVAGQLRHDDVVYRYGGEEFCVLLPHADGSAARVVADRIVTAARTLELPDGSNVTVSVGVAEGGPTDVATTLATADRALYAAKADGRDRANAADDHVRIA
jgi:diguanylate cyclase (GGDEF)-like protein